MHAEQIKRIDSEMSKLSNDVRESLRACASDLTAKLDSKSADLSQQVAQERQERTRAQEAICSQIDLKSKILEERLSYEKEETRERFFNLENFAKTELKRTEEAIEKLHANMEDFFREMERSAEVFKGDCQRSFALIEEEFGAKTNSIETDVDFLKKAINSEYGKISEIIKEEINARFSSDV